MIRDGARLNNPKTRPIALKMAGLLLCWNDLIKRGKPLPKEQPVALTRDEAEMIYDTWKIVGEGRPVIEKLMAPILEWEYGPNAAHLLEGVTFPPLDATTLAPPDNLDREAAS